MTDHGAIRDLFVWIPKTAGSSLAAWLNPAGMPELGVLSELLHDPNRYSELAQYPVTTFGHIDVDSLIERGDLTSAQLADCWAFAVVRNPFSRVVSLHRYLITLGWLAPETDLVQFLREVAGGVAPLARTTTLASRRRICRPTGSNKSVGPDPRTSIGVRIWARSYAIFGNDILS